MRCLIVKAHPLSTSLCANLTEQVIETLQQAGHEVTVEDLYTQGFTASLTETERGSYYNGSYNKQEVLTATEHLLEAEAIVLVFPTWWFGFPAILKGWFDRVWAPGVAYDHADQYGPIKPRLTKLRYLLAVTTLGSPWWVDTLIMRQPVKRVLKTALVGTCAPKCKVKMLSLYKSEKLTEEQVSRFKKKIITQLLRWPH